MRTKKWRAIVVFIWLAFLVLPMTVYANPNMNPDCSHTFIIIETVPPTLLENGRHVHQCSLCGVQYTEAIRATGYIWGEWYIYQAPTCTAQGIRRRTRTLGEVREETQPIPAVGHDWTQSTTAATCTTSGTTTRTCRTCNITETISRTDALGKQWSGWVTYTEPQEGIDGLRYRECEICREREYEVIAALPIPSPSPTPPPTLPPSPSPPITTPAPTPEPTPHPTPEPWFGVEEAIVTGTNVMLWIILGIILIGEFNVFFFVRKRKREILKMKENEKKGLDGYELI